MNDSILLDKREPTKHTVFQAGLLALLVGIAIGWIVGAWIASAHTTVTRTMLVPSNDYATPYDVCQKGFPFVLNQVIVQKVKGDDNITWVAGHPLNQKQVIVCSKAGDYSDVWKRGMIIALYSADPT